MNSVKECALLNSIGLFFGCIVLKCTKSGYWGLQFSTFGCDQLQCEGMETLQHITEAFCI